MLLRSVIIIGYQKDVDFSPKINDLPYPPDLEDALADDTFNLTPIETPITVKANEIAPSISQIHIDGNSAVIIPVNDTLTQGTISRKFIAHKTYDWLYAYSRPTNPEKKTFFHNH